MDSKQVFSSTFFVRKNLFIFTPVKNYTGEDLKPHTVGVLCTAKRQIVTDTAPLKI
jgi:hypothetical protein